MAENDFEIFEGKTFQGLCKEIYDRSDQKKDNLDLLISELRPFVRGIDDALQVVPLIRGYLDISISNDEQLVKLAQVVQRLQTAKVVSGGGEALLSEAEKDALWNEVKEAATEVSKPIPQLSGSVNSGSIIPTI